MTKETTDIITLCVSIFGALAGVTGTVLGVLNYLRDRASARVTLQWDMAVTDNPLYDPHKSWGLVRVTNTGRRPLHLSVVAIELPKASKFKVLLLLDSIAGMTLAEGSRPAAFVVDQTQMQEYAAVWNKIRARAQSSTGKRYRSKYPKERPSWAISTASAHRES